MIKLFNGDCLEVMKDIQDKSIDLILCDLPYGQTACKWDNVIPFEPLWEQYNRIIKDNGAIVLFGLEPFSSKLRMSNLKMYKYDWVWVKTRPTGFVNAKKRPMKAFELVSVFSKGTCANKSDKNMIYIPQGLKPCNKVVDGRMRVDGEHKFKRKSHRVYVREFTNYPKDVLYFSVEGKILHPTQKPTPLLEYLIKTYTNENETVLDNCMGSGSTGVACKNLNRHFIGIELDKNYFEIAKKRIENE